MSEKLAQAYELAKSLDALVQDQKEDSNEFKTILSFLLSYVDQHELVDLFIFNKLTYFIYKRDHSGSEELFRYSLASLKIKVSNDAIEYAARSLLFFAANRDSEFITSSINKLGEINFSAEELIYVNFIYGCIEYSKGNYNDYIAKLRLFQNRALKTYFKIPASTSNADLLINELATPLALIAPPVMPKDRHIVICFSCDEVYFHKYSHFAIESILKTQAKPFISIHIIIESEGSKELILNKIAKYDNGCIGVNFTISSGNIRPLSSLVRYLDAFSYSRMGIPIIVADLDSIFLSDLNEIKGAIPANLIGLRCRRDTCCPWEVYTAGFSYFGANEITIEFLRLYAQYASYILDTSYDQWWIDQNCLEASVRHMLIKRNYKFFVDLTPMLDKYIYLPTGSSKKNISKIFNNI